MAKRKRRHVLKHPGSVASSKKHSLDTELAGWSDECCPADVLFCGG